tara:strand:- start:890 stop:2314 length:1425 start_codon:yes stop_codon:yes gene_type:complete
MASEIRVNSITNRSGLSTVTWNDEGLNIVGVVTATSFVGDITGAASQLQTDATGANLTLTGNLGVGGTITYEDVARVDATGISTFREGFGVGPLTGIALTAYADGSIRTSGIITATTFSSDTDSIFTTGGSEKLRIDSSGNVVRMVNSLRFKTNSSGWVQYMQGGATNPGGTIRFSGGNVDGDLRFYAQGATATLAERMRVTSDGRVLIGTTTPSTYTNRQLVVGDTSTNSSFIEIRCSSSSTGHILFADSAAGSADNYTGYIAYTHSSNHMSFHTDGGNERLRIGSSGELGIGGANYGSSGQVIKSAGTSAAPAWGPMAFSSFAIICDKKGSNDDGGSATAGNYSVYDVRNLNHEMADPDSIVSISSNQFTLVAGTYWVEWRVPAYGVDMFTAELINVTDGTGNRGSAPGKCNTDSVTYLHGSSYFTIAASKTFEIRQHNQTARSGNGLGVRAGYSNSSLNETFYTFVYIYKK